MDLASDIVLNANFMHDNHILLRGLSQAFTALQSLPSLVAEAEAGGVHTQWQELYPLSLFQDANHSSECNAYGCDTLVQRLIG